MARDLRLTAYGSRLTMIGVSLLIAVALFRPLWHIGLLAPQYPEGLGMYIWASRITGEKPHDLQSLNGLNHYIGMKAIVPASIPELRFMTPILAALVVTGLVAALSRRRWVLWGWTGVFALIAVVGLADFWRWGYEYGHELDPTAAIKVPGMSYQPPLLGSKQLLNFHATSWPAVGGIALMAALAVAVVISVLEWRRSRVAALAAVALTSAAACGTAGPPPIAFGDVPCAHCHMTVSDSRFAAELVTTRGRTRVFDDAGCLAAFLGSGEGDARAIRSLWVSDYVAPGTMLPADSAHFVRSDSLRTPMDTRIVAVGRRVAAESLAAAVGGVVLAWSDVLAESGHHTSH